MTEGTPAHTAADTRLARGYALMPYKACPLVALGLTASVIGGIQALSAWLSGPPDAGPAQAAVLWLVFLPGFGFVITSLLLAAEFRIRELDARDRQGTVGRTRAAA